MKGQKVFEKEQAKVFTITKTGGKINFANNSFSDAEILGILKIAELEVIERVKGKIEHAKDKKA